MDSRATIATLQSLGVSNPEQTISNVEDGSTTLLSGTSGSNIALLRHADRFDTLVLGARPDCPVPSLRAMLESAVLPFSETYADAIGIATPERDAVRRRIREASVALDVLAKGRLFSVAPPDMPLNPSIRQYVSEGAVSADQIPEDKANDLALLNQLHANVVSWSREIDRLVQMARTGPADVLSAEAETVFWSSLDAALSSAQLALTTKVVKISLELLARKRRATGFLIDANNSLDTARRKAAGVLTLIQGLPIVTLRTADNLSSLRNSVDDLLDHIAAKLRISSFSIERVLSLVDSMGAEVKHSMSRILSRQGGGILVLPFGEFESTFEACYELFEAWSQGFDHCRKVARDAARKKGEAMPPRRKSSLSVFHAHLTDIYELRADHHALRTTLLELVSKKPAAAKRIEMLDLAYSIIVEKGGSLRHFDLSSEEEGLWLQLRSDYTSQVMRIEDAINTDYTEIINEGHDLRGLSRMLTPFRRLLDKQFMTTATTEAISKVQDLGRRELSLLRTREESLNASFDLHAESTIPLICIKLGACRLLQARAAALISCLRCIVGATHLEVALDLRDFLSDIENLRLATDPPDVFSRWLDTINLNSYRSSSSLIRVLRDVDGGDRLSVDLDPSAAEFFKVVQLVRDDPDLHILLSSRFMEFSRTSKALFPAYSNLKESLSCYNGVCDKLKGLDEFTYIRILPFLTNKRKEVESLLEDGVEMHWGQASAKLLDFSFKLLSSCSAFSNLLLVVSEHDSGIQCAVNELFDLNPRLQRGRLCRDSTLQLESSLKKLYSGSLCLAKQFAESDVLEYIQTHWFHHFHESIHRLLKKLSLEWISMLRSGGLTKPIDLLNGSSVGTAGEFHCTPPISDVELALYSNLGRLYDLFCKSVRESGTEPILSTRRVMPSVHVLFSCFFLHTPLCTIFQGGFTPFTAIRHAITSLISQVEEWNVFSELFRLRVSGSGADLETHTDSVETLEQLTSTYEGVLDIQQRVSLQAAKGEQWLSVDITSLVKESISTILEILGQVCDQESSRAASKSHEVYRTLGDAKLLVTDAMDGDGTEVLVALQSVKDDILPSCTSCVQHLSRLEDKFEEIAVRTRELSFARAQSSETWILSDDLEAQLQTLNDLYEQRHRSVLINHEILEKRYQSGRQSYQEKLASLFVQFRNLRNSDSEGPLGCKPESVLDNLEEQLSKLEVEGRKLERVGKALGIPQALDRDALTDILSELKKLRTGLLELSVIEGKLDLLLETKFNNFDPVSYRCTLEQTSTEVDNIAKFSGVKREVGHLKNSISGYAQMNMLLSRLHSVKLSQPRERDLLQRLFSDSHSPGGMAEVSLKMFWKADILAHESYLRTVFENAAGEAAIADFLAGISLRWSARMCTFYSREGTPILQGIPELMDDLEEHLQGLATMTGSQYARLFESERAAWEQRLANCRENLEVLSDVQARWAHLRTLFGSENTSGVSGLRRELHEEFSAFSNVHARFASLGERLEAAPGILEGMEGPLGLDDMLEELLGIVRGLSKFLEKQRSKFPRFFFLSDGDLLQVLSTSPSSLESLMPHAGKLFPGVHRFDFEVGTQDCSARILSISSSEGEVLQFNEPVRVDSSCQVTSWLLVLQERIIDVMRCSLPRALDILESKVFAGSAEDMNESVELCLGVPAQIVLLATKICFTKAFELCFGAGNEIRSQLKLLGSRISRWLAYLRNSKPSDSRLLRTERRFLVLRDQLIKECVYQKDLISRAEVQQMKTVSSHIWHHQLRFYETASESSCSQPVVVARCASGEFEYGWEYLGMGDTLVHTSLTSRCYLTLCEALRRGFGGSPFGPAGTGKTETVKALGRLLGRFVAVFNCDETFDAVSVGRILAGACRVGSWVCFDEFNRLSSSILSSTSGQLALLQASIRNKDYLVDNFYGGDLPISIQPGVGVFVTMNPTYSGRRELPANLKSLFRPCAMSKPDSGIIVEVLLLSQGFQSSSSLSKKLVTLFDGLKSNLKPRAHYDFGLRSLKSTILASGTLKASSPTGHEDFRSIEGLEENIVVQAMEEVLKPKLEFEDIAEYVASVALIFSQASRFESKLPENLELLLQDVLVERGLVKEAVFLEKIRQLFAMLQHQSGIMLVGPAGSGKSTVWGTLREALARLSSTSSTLTQAEARGKRKNRISLTVLDAKLLSMKQLYGYLDPVTREWTDGLFTKTLRGISDASVDDKSGLYPLHWIVFDGDVDPDWIENLNSVLDDNRILTLPNGEQVPLLYNTRILFETDSLNHANPSTVSRCGMICFGDSCLIVDVFSSSVKSLFQEMCPSCPAPDSLLSIAKVVVQMATDVIESRKVIMQLPVQSILQSTLLLLRNTLVQLKKPARSGLKKERSSERMSFALSSISLPEFLRVYLVAAVKCVGAGLRHSDQCDLSETFIRRVSSLKEVQDALAGVVVPGNLASVSLDRDAVFVSYADLVSSHDDAVATEEIGSPDVVIATPTTLRLELLLRDALNLEDSQTPDIFPVLLCGPPGCGKSMILTAALRNIPNVSLAILSFSSQTSPESILAALRGQTRFVKRPNGSLSLCPKAAGCRVVLFCDEVNLERPDSFETQRSICMLRSLAEHGGFWYGSPPQWVTVQGVQLVAACNPEEDAGRHKLSSRFLRHCMVVRVEQPNSHDLQLIYNVFANSLLTNINPRLVSRTTALTTAMVEFFTLNKNRFSPEQSGSIEPHYVYSPRELSRWIRGMKQLLIEPHCQGSAITGAMGDSKSEEKMWDDVVMAFCYEGQRLFSDRLLHPSERNFANCNLFDVATRHLGVLRENLSDTMYTSWMASDDGLSIRRFKPVRNQQQFRALVYQKLRVFAEEEGLGGSWMSGSSEDNLDGSNSMIDQFAVTDDVLTHLTRIERILCQPLGHAVLMGAPGTGKKTLARFAAWMLSIEVHQVHSHSSYSEQDFAVDLRTILKRAGVGGCQIMMIFDESNALDSAFLEMMNSILACGEVPGLFDGEDRSSLIEELRNGGNHCASSSTNEHALYSEFVNRVRNNLHVVFTISTGCSQASVNSSRQSSQKAGGDIGSRSPALYNRCTVDWIGDWTQETLEAVADLKIEVSLGQEKDQIIRSAVQMHEIARTILRDVGCGMATVTPRHYLEFMEQLNRIALEKGNAIQAGVKRHKEGLRHLRNAGAAVDSVKDALMEKTEDLQMKEQHANETLKTMIEEQRSAEKSKVGAEQLALAASEASIAVREREEEVAAQLDAVQPKIEAAREAVGSIRKEFLEELRAMPNPPAGARIALEGVMMLLDASSRKPDMKYTWGSIRTRMRGSDFIASVVNFDAGDLPSAVRGRIERKILNNGDFDVQRIAYASRAAGPLAEWTLAILDYAAVKDAVEPLQKEVSSLQEEQEELVERQEKALENVQVYEERIEKCRTEYASLVAEAERIRQEIQESEANLARSEEMLDSLADEWDRWIKELNAFNAAAVTVWGNSVFGAAFVAYAGALDHSNRSILGSKWKQVLKREGIPFETDLKISEFLTSAEERGGWTTHGLPTDATSLENYAILKRSARFPLIVDPTRTNSKLLRKVLIEPTTQMSLDETAHSSSSSEALRITKTSFTATGKKSYMRALESSMRFGTSILVEDADKFDRAVAPLLGQESSYGTVSDFAESFSSSAIGKDGPRNEGESRRDICQRVVRLGDRDVVLSSTFRMYLSTAVLKAVPGAAVTRSNVVSFELSPAALGSTCVSRAMKIVVPDLEKRRRDSISAKLALRQRKEMLEEKVLSAINHVEDLGSELLGGSLLNTLSNLKEEVRSLQDRQLEESRTAKEMKESESLFEPLGNIAIKLFSVAQRLSVLNPIYSFNTEFFLGVFEKAISAYKNRNDFSPQEGNTVKVCQIGLLKQVHISIASSLFPKDRLPFAAALSVAAYDLLGSTAGARAWQDLATVLRAVDGAVQSNIRLGTSTNNKKTLACVAEKLPKHLLAKLQRLGSEEFTSQELSPLEGALGLLHKALVEEHCVLQAIEALACTLPGGQEVVHSDDVRSETALRQYLTDFSKFQMGSNGSEPALFPPLLIMSRGDNVDPASEATTVIHKLGLPLISVAMGAEHSEASVSETISLAIRRSVETGRVVLLFKNVHLASRQTAERLHSEVVKRNGRLPCLLVVALEVSSSFGSSLAADISPVFKSIAFESPPSFRANFSDAIDKLSSEPGSHLQGDTGNIKMQIVLSWLHASLLERAVHHPVGFTKKYDFSQVDFVGAWEAMSAASSGLEDDETLGNLVHLLTIAVYGGRIEHSADLEVMRALVGDLLSSIRVVSTNTEYVTLLDGQVHGAHVSLPLNSSEMNCAVRSWPVEVPPQWSHMPSGTNESRQTIEGRLGVRKILCLCHKGLGDIGRSGMDEEPHGGYEEDSLGSIIALGKSLPTVGYPSFEAGYAAPIARYLKCESNVLGSVVDTIRSDIELMSAVRKTFKESARIALLEHELSQVAENGQKEIPVAWSNLSSQYGEGISLQQFLGLIRQGVQVINDFSASSNGSLDFSAAFRPNALLTALRYAAAVSLKKEPHSLEACIAGESTAQRGSQLVTGLVLEGARWDSPMRRFILAESVGSVSDTFALYWAETSDPTHDVDTEAIHLPLYGRGSHRTVITHVRVPVKNGQSLQKWRLRGACFLLPSTNIYA